MNASALLLALALASFPPIVRDAGQPITAEKVSLGKKLFFDKRVSAPVRNPAGQLVHTVSCATCHNTEHGFADGRPLAVGILGQVGVRNTPTVLNAIYAPLQFWDGRTLGARNQALLPIVNPIEMGQQTEGQVLRRLNGIAGYRALCQSAYGQPNLTREIFADAITCFESELLSFNAPIDKRLAGDFTALSPEAEIGFGLFVQADCMACHKPPFYSNFALLNNGAAFFFGSRDQGRAAVLPQNAPGRNRAVRAFKVPPLREVARTAPYLHNGSVASLGQMIDCYSAGAVRDGRVDGVKDPRVRPLNFTERQKKYLVTFLEQGFASPDYPLIKEPALPR